MRAELNDKLSLINSASDDTNKLEGVIRQKQSRIEYVQTKAVSFRMRLLS